MIGDVSPAVALDAAAAAMAEVEPVVEHVTVKSEVWGAFDDDMGQRYYFVPWRWCELSIAHIGCVGPQILLQLRERRVGVVLARRFL